LEPLTSLRIVAATNNRHKLSEIRPLIEPDFRLLSLEEIGCREELSETQETLEGNSLQKASYVFQNFRLPCFADDTGLEVEALNGAPGVYSARYAGDQRNGDDNIELLLHNLSGKINRKAQFRTVITLMGLGDTQVFEGIIRGRILTERHGKGGFGYDPVFEPEGHSRTLAEMTLEEKNHISHRGRAIRKLVEYLKGFKHN
jgi:XTP/dITP diphosphohydrolase